LIGWQSGLQVVQKRLMRVLTDEEMAHMIEEISSRAEREAIIERLTGSTCRLA
jgi:hypothetical protein